MISSDEVKKIAQLARIEIAEDQIVKYQAELSAILDFVGALSSADTAEVSQIRQITGLESVFRKDGNPYEVGLRKMVDQGRDLIQQAPEHKEGYIVVPEVLKK